MLTRGFCKFSPQQTDVSSANKIHLTNLDTLQISFIYRINNSGPNTDPWGTPHTISKHPDEHSPIFTNCGLFFK